MSLKRAEVWGFQRPQLRVQSCALKAKFTTQLGSWLQRTAPMISALHTATTSVERYFCFAYSFMPLSWHRLACTFPAGNAVSVSQPSLFANSTYRELHPAKPGAAPALQPGKADRVRRTGPHEQCRSGKGTQVLSPISRVKSIGKQPTSILLLPQSVSWISAHIRTGLAQMKLFLLNKW